MEEIKGYVHVLCVSTGDPSFMGGLPFATVGVGPTGEDEAILVIRASPSDPANVLTIKLGLIQALLAAEATNRQVSCYYSDTDAEILHVGF